MTKQETQKRILEIPQEPNSAPRPPPAQGGSRMGRVLDSHEDSRGKKRQKGQQRASLLSAQTAAAWGVLGTKPPI